MITLSATMPPKKKGRVPSRAASTPSGNTTEPTAEEISGPTEGGATEETPVTDRVQLDFWTDEQETSLFKAMIRWKPVGSFSIYIREGRTLRSFRPKVMY